MAELADISRGSERDLTSPGYIEVVEIAVDAIHQRGFEVSVAGASPDYNFAHYNCPIVLLDESGQHEWPAGVSVIYAPDNPRYLLAESADLQNSWFHFNGPGVLPCLKEYNIPINRVLDLGELPFLRPILEEVRRERTQRPLHWEDAVSDSIRSMFRQLGMLKSELDNEMSAAQRHLERVLRDVRMQVQSDLSHRWTVPEMAAIAGLHPAWFANVYTNQFGISPVSDLINARLKHAEALLMHMPMTISEVAVRCGFASTEHFTRLFHSRLGCAPTEVRKNVGKDSRPLRRAVHRV